MRYTNAFDTISVIKNGLRFKIGFSGIYGKWLKKMGGVRIQDVFEDPINDNISIVLSGTVLGQLHMVTWDEKFDISKIQIFEICTN